MRNWIKTALSWIIIYFTIFSQAITAQIITNWLEQESLQQREQRMQWWREARFGMFIHWGIYAIPAGIWEGKEVPGIGEWIMNNANIPREEYEKLAKEFNPVKYDPAQWVRIAKQAGMKYLVITSKHHDGFCIFDSKETEYDVIDASPYKKDILKMLADECKRQDIKFGVYYSIMDWHHPSQEKSSPNSYNPTKIVPSRKQEYMNYMKAQLKELITQYDPEILWFDGGWPDWFTREDGIEIYNYVRSLKPSIIINDRLKGVGDFGTPEQYIPATGLPGRDWETCMTMNDTWGYKKNDHNWKSTQTLIRNLVDIVSKGGNYLLNVGPTAEGEIPEPSVERLLQLGQWLNLYGESIYGTRASLFRKIAWGRSTTKSLGQATRLYFHVFEWPADGRLRIPGLVTDPTSCYILPERAPLKWQRDNEDLILFVPVQAPNKICSVVVVEVEGMPKVIEPLLKQAADGSIILPAIEAICHGHHLQYEPGERHDNLGFWTDPGDWAQWRIQVDKPGRYTIKAVLASPGSPRFELRCGATSIEATCPKSGDYYTYQEVEIGQIELEKGPCSVELRAIREGWTPMNVRAIKFIPVQ